MRPPALVDGAAGALVAALAGGEGPDFAIGGGPAAGLFFQTSVGSWQRSSLAIGACIAGNTLIALGLLVQKTVHHEPEPTERRPQQLSCPGHGSSRLYFLTPRWLAGLAAFLLGHGCCAAGLALGACTVLSCLNCWCIVVTLLLAPCFLNETVTAFKVGAVALLMCGCVWVILHGPHGHHDFSAELLRAYLQNWLFQAICACVAAGTLLLGAHAATTQRRPRLSAPQLTLLAAICAWFSVLGAKCVSGLLLTSWRQGQPQFGSPWAWAAVTVFASMAVLNIHLLNMALAAGDAVVVMPTYEAMSLTGQILVGGVFFDELSGLGQSGPQFWLGVSCVLLGIVLVTGRELEPQAGKAALQAGDV